MEMYCFIYVFQSLKCIYAVGTLPQAFPHLQELWERRSHAFPPTSNTAYMSTNYLNKNKSLM